jgi:hypothetical protein
VTRSPERLSVGDDPVAAVGSAFGVSEFEPPHAAVTMAATKTIAGQNRTANDRKSAGGGRQALALKADDDARWP